MGLSPSEMQEAIIKNLRDKTGKTLEQWLSEIKKLEVKDDKELFKILKTTYGLGHFQAQVIIKKRAEGI